MAGDREHAARSTGLAVRERRIRGSHGGVAMTDMEAGGPRGDDAMVRFELPAAGVRGALVRLSDTWRSIGGRSDYPPQLQALLGQTTAAAALFGGHSKINGSLGIQLKGTGGLKTLFAEYSSRGTLRGIALFDPPLDAQLSPQSLGADALLAITVETTPPGAGEAHRYQGLVALEGERIEEAFEHYFKHSEQLPTRLLLASDADRACGLLIQQIPGADRQEGSDADGWNRASALFETLQPDELLSVDAKTLLHRLFHEEQPTLLAEQPLAFACSCTRARVGAVLMSLGIEESLAASRSQPDGVAEIACEMCGERYRFDEVDIAQLFAGGGSEPPEQTH